MFLLLLGSCCISSDLPLFCFVLFLGEYRSFVSGAAVNDRKQSELSIYVGVPGLYIGIRYYGPNGQQRDIQTATMHQPYGCMHRRMDVCMEGMHGRF